ncbi:serine/threonine-protein kinase [Streptomyces sp. 1331.2]|uniref:serine/threonine-protein kinase n=1 Tax=Streptomyces sp. 1331.2 TaxID=1938835 RepID=UPI000BCD6BDC|nr:serine/threonine-protein kinase [Streptomyces sp. 1331.2]SOB80737.1 Serine/threonine protein kinase [Streptomyces sp. 1331.2]
MSGAGTVLGGRYRLVGKIGGGAMGSVWRAEDTVLARQVAVKILRSELFEDETATQRFRREAQLVAAVDHPGIVDVHDYGESGEDGDERCAYIVMELIAGSPLDRVLANSGPMTVGRALELVAGALDALHAAHQQDIVHRDIKPSNLMVRTDGRVAITDFGIARALASTKLTAPFAIIGTALYMSPEQAEGAALGPATDLYSIGVVCYELLVGEPPYSGEGPLQIALKHVNQPVPELPETFPAAVRALVAKALAKKPEERFADAAEMAAAARAAAGGAGAEAEAGKAGVGGAGAGKAGVGEAGDGKANAGGAREHADGGEKAAADSRTIRLRPDAASAGRAGGGDAKGGGAGAAGAAGPKAEAGAAGTAAKKEAGQAGAVVVPAAGGDPAPDEVAKVLPQAQTEPGRARHRRALLVPVIIPVIISVGTATALLVDRSPGGSDAAVPPAAQPTVVVTVPANPGTGSPLPAATTAPPAPVPTDTPAATPNPDQPAPGVPNQQVPVPAQGQAPVQGGSGGASGGNRSGGAGTGSASGGGAAAGGSTGGQANQPGGGAGGNPPAPPANQNPQPPAQNTAGGTTPAPQSPPRPASCGGSSWTTIVTAKERRPLGLRNDTLSGDNPVVVGGASQYGWVRSTDPGTWIHFNACNNGGPALVQTMDGKVEASSGFSYLTSWTVRNGSSPGSYTLGDYMNSICLTNNGPGNAVTMVACTPGNEDQEWRFQ